MESNVRTEDYTVDSVLFVFLFSLYLVCLWLWLGW